MARIGSLDANEYIKARVCSVYELLCKKHKELRDETMVFPTTRMTASQNKQRMQLVERFQRYDSLLQEFQKLFHQEKPSEVRDLYEYMKILDDVVVHMDNVDKPFLTSIQKQVRLLTKPEPMTVFPYPRSMHKPLSPSKRFVNLDNCKSTKKLEQLQKEHRVRYMKQRAAFLNRIVTSNITPTNLSPTRREKLLKLQIILSKVRSLLSSNVKETRLDTIRDTIASYNNLMSSISGYRMTPNVSARHHINILEVLHNIRTDPTLTFKLVEVRMPKQMQYVQDSPYSSQAQAHSIVVVATKKRKRSPSPTSQSTPKRVRQTAGSV